MSSASDMFDIAFLGHVCFDEVIAYQGALRVAPGSAARCAAYLARRMEPDAPEALKFAADPVSIKRETSRPVCWNPG